MKTRQNPLNLDPTAGKVPAYLSDNMSWHSAKPCRCGSGLETERLSDARGIPVTFCCSACVVEKAKGYRRDIFENSSYWADESVEGDW